MRGRGGRREKEKKIRTKERHRSERGDGTGKEERTGNRDERGDGETKGEMKKKRKEERKRENEGGGRGGRAGRIVSWGFKRLSCGFSRVTGNGGHFLTFRAKTELRHHVMPHT